MVNTLDSLEDIVKLHRFPSYEEVAVMSDAERVSAFLQHVRQRHQLNMRTLTLVPFLPLLLNMPETGKPYTLDEHKQFEPMFRTRRPKREVLKCARQVGKSWGQCAEGILHCAAIPNYKALFVTPLFEQIRRLSSNHIRPLLDQSPVRALMTGSSVFGSVLQKNFVNGSVAHFGYAQSDASRLRGYSNISEVKHDEVQDTDGRAVFPVVKECMAHSKWGFERFRGTPKTPENIIQELFNDSSQAEWMIPCKNCKYENYCSVKLDLLNILGPYRDDISMENPGTVCANPKCRKVIHPLEGRWVHGDESKRWTFAGYHIPQPIMPIHYGSPEKWGELLSKVHGEYSMVKAYNEVLGESAGTGAQLLSREEIERACLLPWTNNPNDPNPEIEQRLADGDYVMRVLAIDWGGGGEEEISLTALALLGLTPTGLVDVLWGRNLFMPLDHIGEAHAVREWFNRFKCDYLCHDYSGAGSIRETILAHSRVPVEKLVPISYIGSASGNLFQKKEATKGHPRSYYQSDKTRSLQHTIAAIKMQKIRFFKYDSDAKGEKGLLKDFLALAENKMERPARSDSYLIHRHAGLSDDFAQAVNIGAWTLWHFNDIVPVLGDYKPKPYWLEEAEDIEFGSAPEVWEDEHGNFRDY